MNRVALVACVVYFSLASPSAADDYVIRLEASGYTDQPADVRNPKESLLYSIETLARQESAFHAKINLGTVSMTLAGTIRPSADGEFTVTIQHEHSIETGTTVPDEDGTPRPVLNTTSVGTTKTLVVGERANISGKETEVRRLNEPARKSAIRYSVTLNKQKLPGD